MDGKETKAVMEALTALRTEVKEKTVDKDKVALLNTVLDKHEEKNQEILKTLKSSQDAAAEFKERIDALEVTLANRGGEGDKGIHFTATPEYKALVRMIQVGDTNITAEEKNLLRTDVGSDGGYLVRTEMDSMIVKKIVEISNIRSIARVRSIAGKSIELPIRDSIPIATYEGEADAGNDDHSKYRNETVTPYRQTVTIPITRDLLMNAAFNMESELMADAGIAFAKGEGSGFVIGSGVKQPEGFLTNADIVSAARQSTTSGTVEAADVILLTGDLKSGYNPVYVLNRRTLAFLRTLASSTGKFLWEPGMNGPVSTTLNGFPYLIADDMPDIAIGSLPIAFGDFQQGYTIVDRTTMSVVRDDVTAKRQAIVEFTFNRWNTGMVILPEAIKALEIIA